MNTFVGPSVLVKTGLTSYYPGAILQTTSLPKDDKTSLENVSLFYLPDIDEDPAYIQSVERTIYSMVRVPTPERAILDNIRHQDVFEEFYLVDALKWYLKTVPDLSKLREVARHYGAEEELDYWINEAIEDEKI